MSTAPASPDSTAAVPPAISLEINGRKVSARPGQTILDVVTEQKLDAIPTLCHSPELRPYGSCFLCVVEVAGRANLLPSCATRVAEGMKVTTRNERITASRRTALELLLSNHYADCVSPCALACPAGVDCQGYVALAAMGEYAKAIRLIRETNPLPAVCGRVCVRKCEVECRRADVDEPVGINNIKRYVSDRPDAYAETPRRKPSRRKSVGIVGSGPAGLTAAWYLGLEGYDPVIYEALPKPGGMLRYGIPEYRLPNDVLDREVAHIRKAGATIKLGTRVGKDVQLGDLLKSHAAVFIAAGAMGSKGMGVDGEKTTRGVIGGAEFLLSKVEKREPVKGTVVVVGGGNTAMDVARTSWRLKADRVIILYRRTKAEMPADKLEIEDCLKEGIEIMELAAPVGLVAEEGRLKGLRCIRMALGEPDKSGRRRPVPQQGSEFTLPCDLAVAAIGQEPILDGLAGPGAALKVSKWNTIAADPVTMKTNVEGLFAGGDAADDGPTVVVDAIRDGRRAALAINEFLSGEKPRPAPFVVQKSFWAKPGEPELGAIKESPRHEVHELGIEDRRGSFAEVSTGYASEDVEQECARCLACGCVVYDRCDLRLYAQEYGVDMKRFMGRIRKHRIDERHPHLVYDPNRCVLCSRCIRTCARVLPSAALGLVGRGFKTEMRPAMNDPLAQTSCVECGNCVDACPTGALTVKFPFPGRACLATEDVETRCGFCSVGCRLTVKRVDAERYYTTASGRPGDYICRYGRFGAELFIKQRRIASAALRADGKERPSALPEALKAAAAGLKAAAKEHGAGSLAVFVSAELSNEELYLAGRIAREGLGTNNVGSLSLLLAGTETAELDTALGLAASTADRTVLRSADLIICDNTDLQRDQMVLSIEVLEASRRGARLVVLGAGADPLAPIADLRLDPMRGRSAVLWNGVLQALLDRGFFDRSAVARLPGGPEFLDSLVGGEAGALAGSAGVEPTKVAAAADLLAGARRTVFLHSVDRAQDRSPGSGAALANLITLLRAKGVQADLLLLRSGANGAGLEVAGADPRFGPGRRPASGLPGARTRGELLALLERGAIKAALVIGEDPMGSDRGAGLFGKAAFLAAMDWCRTETTDLADVVLPGSTFLESEGTRVNFEGRLHRGVEAVRPPSGSPGWKVLGGLARELGVLNCDGPFAELQAALDGAVRSGLGERTALLWNTGEERRPTGLGRLVAADVRAKPGSIPPPVTPIGRYKRSLRDVGVQLFRVESLRLP